MPYNHQDIEKKWQDRWETAGVFHAKDGGDKPKFYCLIEFPYPSGAGLHIGHPRSYTALDVVSRKRRHQGYNVLYPIGWDAFGLPTENYAIKTGRKPQDITRENTDIFRRQLKSLGLSFDWSREVNTTDPAYYKWTQWMFLEFFKAGLAYKTKQPINWCLSCKIGLANEEVVNGKCERCGGDTEKRDKEQWMIAITKYADRLLEDLDTVDYMEKIKTQQRNWIGKSEGAEVKFQIPNSKFQIDVFTTRPDTIFGATFLVISPELAKRWIDSGWSASEEVREYVVESLAKAEMDRTAEGKEKTGVDTGVAAINPANGKEIPVWVADYVLGSYGAGAIMAVPAHDERDFEFAKKFRLPVVKVIEPEPLQNIINPDVGISHAMQSNVKIVSDCFVGEGVMVNSGEFDGMKSEETKWAMVEKIGARRSVKYKLRDWVFSRQRYWGEPIPLVWCDACAAKDKAAALTIHFYRQDTWDALVSGRKTIETRALNPDEPERFFGNVEVGSFIRAVNRVTAEEKFFRVKRTSKFSSIEELFLHKDLLVKIRPDQSEPAIDQWKVAYASNAPDYLARIEKNGLVAWEVEPFVPGWIPVRDEQLPVVLPEVEKYEPTDTGESPLAAITDWVNTTCPTCGGAAKRETDTMPNWAGSSWYFLRYIDAHNDKEFASREKLKHWMPVDLYDGGMEHTTLHLLYSRFWNKFLFDRGHVPTSEPYARRHSHGLVLAQDGTKMSKSKGNVVNPDEIVRDYGADALRMYILFMGPFEEPVPWNLNGLIGVRRFLEKVEKYVETNAPLLPKESARMTGIRSDGGSGEVAGVLERALKKVSDDIESFKFNTAVSTFMSLFNEIAHQTVTREQLKKILVVLGPFAPHLANECWERIGENGLVEEQPWPTFDEKLLVRDTIDIGVQVNGKVRATITIAPDANEATARAAALAHASVAKHLAGKEIVKVVYVPGKIVNIVVT